MRWGEPSSEEKASQVKEHWIELRKIETKRRQIYLTMLLVSCFSLFGLIIKYIPLPGGVPEKILDSWQGYLAFTFMGIALFFKVWTDNSYYKSDSFVELDERRREEKFTLSESGVLNSTVLGGGVVESYSATENDEPIIEKKVRRAVLGVEFAEHMRTIIEALDSQIDYAEAKASRLLESGRTFVRGGISIYIFSIVLWQGWLYLIDFRISPGVIFGMISTTMIFLIMEFIGAWYLKQYRHYGDSAFSYMRVRSSYNRYMLSYCAIRELANNDPGAARAEMLQVLGQAENWPDLRDVNSNDFNYMLQSVESFGSVFDKLKGIFDRSKASGSPQ
ncbi:hypothetical protein HU720_01925 [Pseudomonas sp. SWRI51]|uniref:hypothetical protein n=1 Tax=Pseudomonas sp. SWRI51 TaxID=2745491 RepID=UPI001645531B|nr:hypothetical protein [Pseudomonas sp. SWRI51]MBC3410062.1 hypothetical protein [Pseudomonas sp. SWRI51]